VSAVRPKEGELIVIASLLDRKDATISPGWKECGSNCYVERAPDREKKKGRTETGTRLGPREQEKKGRGVSATHLGHAPSLYLGDDGGKRKKKKEGRKREEMLVSRTIRPSYSSSQMMVLASVGGRGSGQTP